MENVNSKKILIIGSDAYLARGMSDCFPGYEVDSIARADTDKNFNLFKQYDAVINFTIQPEFSQRNLTASELIDAQIAKCLVGSHTKLVMLSSRKVYGSHENADIIKETDNLDPQDFYAKNKVKAEQALQMILPNRHLILRIANILGEPVNRIGYKTFMGWISESILATGKLTVTENRKTKKDFITRNYLHRVMFSLIDKEATGIFNVGAGFALTLEDLLTKIAGEKNIIFEDIQPPRDQFILNTDKLHHYMQPFTHSELEKHCSLNKGILMNFCKLKKTQEKA